MISFQSLPLLPTTTERVVAFCTAKSYLLKALHETVKTQYRAIWHKDVTYINVAPPGTTAIKEIYCFQYGTIVFWGLEESEEQAFLREIQPFELQPLELPERDIMSFTFGAGAKVEEDIITLPDTDYFLRLALSYGLSQSVKLAIFEYTIQKTIDKTKDVPEQLALQGKIPLSKKEIRKRMGELFIERSSINLHSDILDLPDFFWDHSDVESIYRIIANYLDLKTRIEILNQRLDTVHDLFEMLGNELNHAHSSKLEWIIIWLIVIEVILSLLRDVFNIL